MDFDKLRDRFRQFGGMRLAMEYARLGLVPAIVKSFFRCIVKRQSFKKIYPGILKVVEPYLLQKYRPVLKERKAFYAENPRPHERSRNVWVCWLQGMESAPPVVKACYNSLVRNLPGREVKVIDGNNWGEFVDMPGYICDKWEKRRIPPAMFSDLLRLQLLIKYGGTWIDAAVLCTGECNEYMDSDLFLFRYNRAPGDRPLSISNWFITSCSGSEVLMVLRDVLFAYWRDYDCPLDYYIFHLFFSELAGEYPEQIARMPYGYSPNSLVLAKHWAEPFEPEKWEKLTASVCIHKLSYRLAGGVENDKDNYYKHILDSYK